MQPKSCIFIDEFVFIEEIVTVHILHPFNDQCIECHFLDAIYCFMAADLVCQTIRCYIILRPQIFLWIIPLHIQICVNFLSVKLFCLQILGLNYFTYTFTSQPLIHSNYSRCKVYETAKYLWMWNSCISMVELAINMRFDKCALNF